MDTTEVLWSVDGESLQTYAWNITTLGDTRNSARDTRGDNITVPYAPGTRYMPKVVDEHEMTLGMWVQGSSADGVVRQSPEKVFQHNWRRLRRLLWQPGREFTLSKKFWVPTQELYDAGYQVQNMPSFDMWTLLSASAKASFSGGLEPKMTGPARAAFTVDLLLSDPFFYSPSVSSTHVFNSSVNSPVNVVINVAGDHQTINTKLILTGPLLNPKITNTTLGTSFTYPAEIAAGESLDVDAKNFQAVHFAKNGTSSIVSGKVSRTGSPHWFPLAVGDNKLRLENSAGSNGMVKITREFAWL